MVSGGVKVKRSPHTMQRRFVAITGLPGSGKSQLAHQLAPLLDLPVLDKDVWLESAFEASEIGDATWRRKLSRDADSLFQRAAQQSTGAILVSFWHQPGMRPDSGTPTDWLSSLDGPVVMVRCVCPPEIAADRFLQRERHAGHLDAERSPQQLLEQLRFLASLDETAIGKSISVSTTEPIDLKALSRNITATWSAT